MKCAKQALTYLSITIRYLALYQAVKQAKMTVSPFFNNRNTFIELWYANDKRICEIIWHCSRPFQFILAFPGVCHFFIAVQHILTFMSSMVLFHKTGSTSIFEGIAGNAWWTVKSSVILLIVTNTLTPMRFPGSLADRQEKTAASSKTKRTSTCLKA